ncbi:hypothetical protein ASG49_13890 [Marmoricola sp. Leaf446]|uniref:hypothetical protein n=1 Tax=Marmoricola sp. Leaf446 TaxID=1736379 RepID=UPI0006FEA7BA|nr:hypothetical protein [Marmoricola sp. Leaf446]KQT90823.1 hypothetical protein ASG49_13890 [Marmoricola sp. Leaf446]
MRTTNSTTTGGTVPELTTDTTSGAGTDGSPTLEQLERDVRALVPDLVGLSLCRSGPDGPVTLEATTRRVRLLDALQHLDGGPAPTRDRDVTISRARWPHLARGAAEAGVGSTRAATVCEGEVVVGEVHLYAAGDDPFAGVADDLEALFDEARLCTRVSAAPPSEDTPTQAAPRSLRGDGKVHRVIGQLSVRLGTDPIAAYDRLEASARRAGVGCEDLAAVLVDLRP